MNKTLTTEDAINSIYNEINDNNLHKILLIVPESAGDIFLTTSLFRSISETYAGFEIYLACHSQYKDILKNNPYITKVINYNPAMENQVLMEGVGNWPGLFTISIMVTALTQRCINYYNNGVSKIALNLKYTNHASN
jgi:hypothetical protein